MGFTNEEEKLLEKMASGLLNGIVGDSWNVGKSLAWRIIEDGIPREYKQGPGGRFFDGKENERYPGVKHLINEWTTDEQKLLFLQKYGWLMNDSEVCAYSAKFKP